MVLAIFVYKYGRKSLLDFRYINFNTFVFFSYILSLNEIDHTFFTVKPIFKTPQEFKTILPMKFFALNEKDFRILR